MIVYTGGVAGPGENDPDPTVKNPESGFDPRKVTLIWILPEYYLSKLILAEVNKYCIKISILRNFAT